MERFVTVQTIDVEAADQVTTDVVINTLRDLSVNLKLSHEHDGEFFVARTIPLNLEL